MRVLLSSSTLSAAADAYVWQANASTNYGSNTALQVKDSASSNDRWTYIRFNLSGISSSDAIADATLRLYGHVLQNSGDTASINVVGYSSTDITWGESTITWNNKPTASGTSLASATVPYNNNADKWNTWDISSYIRTQKAAGASAVTLVLEPGNTTDSIASFASREASSNQPQLVVTTVAAPSGLTATAVSSSQINLTWADNSDNETGFKIDRSTNGGSTWSSLTTTAANATSYSDTGLTASTTYTYRIRATNGSVDSANTASASATTQSSGTTTTTDVSASADAYTRDGSYASTNYGSATGLYAKQYSTSNSGYNRNVYLTFDSSGVSGTLDSATVRLYGGISAGSGSESTAVRLYPITSSSWTETGVDWNNQPSAGTSLGYVTISSATAQWYEWDVTSYVNSERANGRNVVGFMVRPDTTASTLFVFNSKEAGSNAPDLRVTTPAVNAAPTIANPASASPATVTGTTTTLSVLGADDGGESNLLYFWQANDDVPDPVTFSSEDGTNDGKSVTVTFEKAGTYDLSVIVTDGYNEVDSAVTVTVNQTVTSIQIDQPGAAVKYGATFGFSATAYDQFGDVMAAQPTFSWSVDSFGAGGTIGSSGTYTASSYTRGQDTVRASVSSVSGTVLVETGQIVGTVYGDANANSTEDGPEAGLSGWRVYLDANRDGQYDSSNDYDSTTTDANGNYALDAPSGYTSDALRASPQSGWSLSEGSSGYPLTLANYGDTAGPESFGADGGPTVTVVATDDSASEATLDTGTFTFHRSSTAGSLQVLFGMSGAAKNGTDYTLSNTSSVGNGNYLVAFPAGISDEVVTLHPLGNFPFSGTEPASAKVENSGSYLGVGGTATVLVAGKPTLTANPNPVTITIPVAPAGPALLDVVIKGNDLNAYAVQPGVLKPTGATVGTTGISARTGPQSGTFSTIEFTVTSAAIKGSTYTLKVIDPNPGEANDVTLTITLQ